jgi:hypothetical protein
VAQPEHGLEPDRAYLERPDNSCAAMLPDKLERICREECEKLPKYRCAKLVTSYPRRLKAVSLPKVLNKVLSKGSENVCKCDISFLFFFNSSKNLFLFVIMGYCVYIDEGEKQFNPF